MLTTLIRTAVLYLVVILCMRLMGKRQVGELQPSELVVTILISELASIPMQDLSRPVTNGIIAIFTLVILEIIISVLSLKLPGFRAAVAGRSAIIIQNGVIDQQMMRRLRISMDDLTEGLRQAGYFKTEQINYAIMETSGKISVLPFRKYIPVSGEDLQLNTPEGGFPRTLVSDGRPQQPLFDSAAERELQQRSLQPSQVFFMTRDDSGRYNIIKKEQ